VRARWLLGALAVAAVAAAFVGWNADDEHEAAWCRLQREMGEVFADAGDDDPFVDPSPEVVRLAAEVNELGYPPKLAGLEPVIGAGPTTFFGPERERYDEAIGTLEAFVVEVCRLDPETLAPIAG
jgi:hypothetical protein